MNSAKEHLDAMKNLDVVKKYGEKAIEKIHQTIDRTANSRGSYWHRSDFSHDPRVVGVEVASDNPEKWFANFNKINDAKLIARFHQIQDAAVSQPGQIINGHELTPEMIAKAKEAVEGMNNGIQPDLRGFGWTGQNGPTMAPGSQINNITQNIKAGLTLDKLGKAGKSGGLIGAGIAGGISIGMNGYAIYKNEKTWKEAGISTLKDTSRGGVAGVAGSVAGYAAQVIVTGLLVSNPGGWAIAATIAASTVASIGGGAAATVAYNKVWNGCSKLFKKKKRGYN